MSSHRIRHIVGMGHQILSPKGELHSTHDTRDEAEDTLDKLNRSGVKEHQQSHWGK